MGIFDGLFHRKPKNSKYADVLSGMTPVYSQFGTDIYASDVVQQALSCIVTEIKKLKLIGSDIRLAGAEVELVSVKEREFYLKKLLGVVRDDYDFIFIDCPPSLSLLTLNAMAASDSVLVPIQCEYYALEGVTALINTINRVKHTFNPHLEIEGILLTMLDGRTNLGLQVVDQVKKHFKKAVFATMIPRNVRLGEAPSHGKPICLYDPRSSGALAYESLAKEVLARNRKKK